MIYSGIGVSRGSTLETLTGGCQPVAGGTEQRDGCPSAVCEVSFPSYPQRTSVVFWVNDPHDGGEEILAQL